MLHPLRVIACALVLVVISLDMRAMAADAGAQKRLPLGAQGQLQLTVPAGWRDKPDPSSPSFSFSPAAGAPFIVTIGPLVPAPATPAALRQEVERALGSIAPFAVEQKIEVMEIKDAAGPGYYFFATDRAPQPGEYKFMTRGALLIGAVPVSFTILTNPGQEQIASSAMTMLKRATVVRTK